MLKKHLVRVLSNNVSGSGSGTHLPLPASASAKIYRFRFHIPAADAIEHITKSNIIKKKSKVETRPTEELIHGLMFVMSPYPSEFVVEIINQFCCTCSKNFVEHKLRRSKNNLGLSPCNTLYHIEWHYNIKFFSLIYVTP